MKKMPTDQTLSQTNGMPAFAGMTNYLYSCVNKSSRDASSPPRKFCHASEGWHPISFFFHRKMFGFVVGLLLFVLFLAPHTAHAARKVVAANLTENFVGVSESFSGAKLTVFGVLKNKADAVVVIEGPPAQANIRAKVKQFGIWVNGEPESISPVPSFYAIVSSRPINEIIGAEDVLKYGFDLELLPFAQTPAGGGYVAVKKSKDMFQYRPDGVKILESNLFRADIQLPPSVPIGAYQAHIYEFAGRKLTAERTETLWVAQIGLNGKISEMAKQNPLLYAVMALVFALGIGGGAAYLFRRMS